MKKLDNAVEIGTATGAGAQSIRWFAALLSALARLLIA